MLLYFEQSKIVFMTTEGPAKKLFPSSQNLRYHSTITADVRRLK